MRSVQEKLSLIFFVLLAALVFAAVPASATNRNVSTTGSDVGTCTISPCLTINYAIGQAVAGDRIKVAAGTYNENIVIDKALIVQGTGSASTFINGTGTDTNITVVYITAAGNVTLTGFTIKNAPVTNDGDLRFGILSNSPSPGVNYTISNNKVIGTNDPDAYEDYGIYGRNGGKENLIITNNVVTQTGSNNIVIETHPGTTDISYNTLDAGCWGTDAIFVMTLSGVDVTSLQKISHNIIDMSTGGPLFDYDHRATGITFATGVTTGVGGQFTNVQITDNNIINLKSYRRGIGFWNNAEGDGSAGDIVAPLVSRNIVTGAPGDVTESMGIDTIGLVTEAIITNNTITGLDYSFKERVWNTHIATGTQLNYNSFSNNSSGVLTERTTGLLNAVYNWWGDASGPGSVGPGTGDKVSTNVDYDPWLKPEITVVSPNSGEKVGSGSTYPVVWKATAIPVFETFDLKYSLDGGSSWINIVTGLQKAYTEYLSYDWKVPTLVAAKPCLLKITGNWLDLQTTDQSDNAFTIAAVILTYPNGGEKLKVGNTYNITWDTFTVKTVVTAELSYTCGGTPGPVATLSGNPGSYSWKVPAEIIPSGLKSTKCKVKVVLKNRTGVAIGKDASDTTFSIVSVP